MLPLLKPILVLGLLLVLVALALIAWKTWFRTDSDAWPYSSKPPLTAVERELYARLQAALPECVILPQVALSSFLHVTARNNYGAWRNRIDRKSIDFLVCLKDELTIVAAVELDDSTHSRTDRMLADDTKTKALEAAGIKLIRWQARSLPTEQDIRRTFT